MSKLINTDGSEAPEEIKMFIRRFLHTQKWWKTSCGLIVDLCAKVLGKDDT